jgi:hypothetical protein
LRYRDSDSEEAATKKKRRKDSSEDSYDCDESGEEEVSEPVSSRVEMQGKLNIVYERVPEQA